MSKQHRNVVMKDDKFVICNIVPDEKFIDGIIDGMDLFSEKWETKWVICSGDSKKLVYIKNHANRIRRIVENSVVDFIENNRCDAVILHSFNVIPPWVIVQIPQNVKVFWFGWGYDIYNFPIYKPFLKWNLYKRLTSRYVRFSIYMNLYHLKLIMKYVLNGYGNLYNKALSRVDFFSGVVDFEYGLLKNNPNFRAQKVQFSYSSLSDLQSFDSYEKYKGDNILLGNSAALTNNHLDIIEYLKKVELNDRKLIIPLSYAGPKVYMKKVEKAFKKAFDTNAVALMDFMPFDEYKHYIQSCSIAVFFMERQQAMGNIASALGHGCKVFLSDKNPVYQYYKDFGMSIFSVEKDFNNDALSAPLSDNEIEKNRAILTKLYGYNAYVEKLTTIYDALLY